MMDAIAEAVETKDVVPVEVPPVKVDSTEALTQLITVFSKFIEQQSKVRAGPDNIKAEVYRKAQSRYMTDFGPWLTTLKVKEIVSVTQSESDGNVTITLFYR